MNLSKEFFFDLERRLREAGLDSDYESFDVIKARLSNKEPLSADGFACQVIYVILAGGFSQRTAKKIHSKIIAYLVATAKTPSSQSKLLAIFNNKNKITAILKIWQYRKQFRDEYYSLQDLNSKLAYLQTLPHIGKITANHLARDLGEDVVKYDIWIQRLGVAFADAKLQSKINNAKLDSDVKTACDKMFAHLVNETGLPRGYIDVVLWKACQNKLINF